METGYYLPLTSDPWQVFTMDLSIDGEEFHAQVEIRYLPAADQWFVSIWDHSCSELLVNMIPLVCSYGRPSRVLSPLVFFPISMHFTAPPEIPSAPTVLQLGSFHRLSRVEPWDLTANLKSHLQTLYAQSFRITLASSVLPRLLAQS